MASNSCSIPNSVLILCYGNICRSPVAEYLLRFYAKKSKQEKLYNINFDSAGLDPVFSKMSENSEKYLNNKGISTKDFQSKRITPNLLSDFDLILVLEEYMIDRIAKNIEISGKTSAKPFEIKTLVGYAIEEKSKNRKFASFRQDIEDPYGLGYKGYKKILDKIDYFCEKIIENWKIRL